MNPLIEEIKHLEKIQGYDVTRSVATAPWPLHKRIMYSVRYPKVDIE